MDSTRRLEIDLPEDMAEAVSARVASGRFASESEVVAAGLALLDDQDQDGEFETWLRGEVVPAYEDWKARDEKGLSADEVRTSLDRRRAARHLGDPAE